MAGSAIVPINTEAGSFPGVSTAVRLRGDLVILSGHVPVAADGSSVRGSFRVQLQAVFESIGRTLRAAGLDFSHVARLTYYVVDFEPSMLADLREVRSGYVDMAAPPASALVSVAALYDPEVRVEVDGFAVAPAEAP